MPLPTLQPIEGEEYELRIVSVSTGKTTMSLKGKAAYASLLDRLDTTISIVS